MDDVRRRDERQAHCDLAFDRARLLLGELGRQMNSTTRREAANGGRLLCNPPGRGRSPFLLALMISQMHQEAGDSLRGADIFGYSHVGQQE